MADGKVLTEVETHEGKPVSHLANNLIGPSTKVNMKHGQLKATPEKTATSHARASATDADSLPPLLRLPAEMRNTIYRLALLKRYGILIGHWNREQPALMRTCRQLRNEASGIFYEENKVTIEIRDLDFTVPDLHWANRSLRPLLPRITLSGVMVWANLMKWLERFYNQRVLGLGLDGSTVRVKIVARACAIVKELRSVPWASVQEVLEHFCVATQLGGFT